MRLIIILGPTAVGKTKIASHLAKELEAEIISADSRQVYKGLNIGAGKDLNEYQIGELRIPYHLIDIREIGDEYNLFRFQQDFYQCYDELSKRNKKAILCGGTGLYIEAALAKNQLIEVPTDEAYRQSMAHLDDEELKELLIQAHSSLHNQTDLTDRARTIRALEIERYKKQHPEQVKVSPLKKHIIFGVQMDRTQLRERIKLRLDQRFNEGMIKEVEELIHSGVSIEQLKWFGLEYRYIGAYLNKEINYDCMYEQLLQAIRRFAKKQMTWYRRMEKQGHFINWINAELSMEEKINYIKNKLADDQ